MGKLIILFIAAVIYFTVADVSPVGIIILIAVVIISAVAHAPKKQKTAPVQAETDTGNEDADEFKKSQRQELYTLLELLENRRENAKNEKEKIQIQKQIIQVNEKIYKLRD